MKPVVLVVSTVHRPDDTRIRERLIRSLARSFEVIYAAREPGPSDITGLRWTGLGGRRLVRSWNALKVILSTSWDVMVIHDPELLPHAVLARMIRRKAVVFDVHENVPATAFTRHWVPTVVRRPLSRLLRWTLLIVERLLVLTLAESGYRSLFSGDHPVFPNYPDTSRYPAPRASNGKVVYLGDITVERGAVALAQACARVGRPLELVGSVSESTAVDVRRASGSNAVELIGPKSNPEAIEIVVEAGVGVSPLLDLPNYRDSQPTKIIEYLALGIPVVATNLPGTRSLVEGLVAVELVEPGDVAGLARAIDRNLQPEARSAASSQAHSIKSKFRWPADEVEAFYLSLV